jgi:hypothetical protein
LDKTLPQALAKKENLPVTKIYKARPPPFNMQLVSWEQDVGSGKGLGGDKGTVKARHEDEERARLLEGCRNGRLMGRASRLLIEGCGRCTG